MASLGLKRSLFEGSLRTPLRRANCLTGQRGSARRLWASDTELVFFFFLKNVHRIVDVKEMFKSEKQR